MDAAQLRVLRNIFVAGKDLAKVLNPPEQFTLLPRRLESLAQADKTCKHNHRIKIVKLEILFFIKFS